MTVLTPDDFERSGSWNLVIAAELLRKDGEEAPYRDEGKERYLTDTFHVCRQSGAWYSWAAAKGGLDALSLIKFLRPDYAHEDATRWLVKFLAANPGTGQLEAEDGELSQARREALTSLAKHYLETAEPLAPDGPEVDYLRSRALPGPYPPALRRITQARPGESALIMPLTAFGRVTGVMVTYIDALGEKSLVAPGRRRLDIERAPGAVMVIQEPTPGVVDISATMIIAEGLENAMSIAHREVAHPGWLILGVPGVNTLKNVPAKAGDRIIVFQDSDPEGHPAQLGLQAGIDSLLLQGAQVRRTEWSEHGDANAILQAKGPAELKRLLARPAGAPLKFEGEKLSIDGEIARLARLSPADYEKERKKVAKDSEWRVTALDKAVARLRPTPAEAENGSPEPSISLPVDPPWAGPVPQLAPLLDRITAEVRRYVVLQEWQAHLVAVWAALTYFVFDPRIDLQVMPRLAIQSAAINSGKTALLRIVCTLARHGKLYGRATSAGIYRALSQAELTLCLDEVEFLRNDPYSPMMQVLDSSHHREDANILLTEPQQVGPPIARELSTWAAMALACNGQLPGSLQSRSIVVVLLRALASEDHEFLEKRSTPELIGLRRELTAWAATIAELPLPSRSEMPAEVYNRDGDNWRPMFAIAKLAGDVWLERIREASLKAAKTETLPPLIVSLLSSVERAFREDPKSQPEDWVDPQPNTWLDTQDLVARLIVQEGEPWGKVNRGGPVDPYWLRTKFINLLDPPGAQDWWQTVKGGKRKHRSGYFFEQFADALRRFPKPPAGVFDPDDTHAETSPKKASASGASSENSENPNKTAIFYTPDGLGASGADRVHPKASKSAGDEPLTPLAPDAPGGFTPSSVCVPKPDEWGWVRGAETASAAVSLLITQAQKMALRDLGYIDEQVREMSPAAAHQALGLLPGAEPASVEQPSAAETEKPPESGDPPLAPAAPPRANGLDENSTKDSAVELPAPAGPKASPVLDMSEPSLIDYFEGSIAADVRQLRAANPERSVEWLARQSGQPLSVVREILGDGEDAQ